MENPATWGKAEQIIHKILLDNFERNLARPLEAMCGLSVERRIADALRDEGLLIDGDSD